MSLSILNQQKKHKIDVRRIRRNLHKLLRKLDCQDNEICILFVDDEHIHDINKIYLKRDHPTNVISFAMTEGSFGNVHPEILGDIVVSVETAARDAKASGLDMMDEVEFLVIHGLLHLLGYNHESNHPHEAEEMGKQERELFFFLRHYDLD